MYMCEIKKMSRAEVENVCIYFLAKVFYLPGKLNFCFLKTSEVDSQAGGVEEGALVGRLRVGQDDYPQVPCASRYVQL